MNYNWDAVAYLNNFDSYDYVYELLASPSIRRAVILIHAKRRIWLKTNCATAIMI